MLNSKIKMAGLVDYAANSDSEEEISEKANEDAFLHLKDTKRSIDDMKNNMQLNIRPEVTSKVSIKNINLLAHKEIGLTIQSQIILVFCLQQL